MSTNSKKERTKNGAIEIFRPKISIIRGNGNFQEQAWDDTN